MSITEEDRDYVNWDWSMIPVVCATLNSLFEGNTMVLNIYSEAEQP